MMRGKLTSRTIVQGGIALVLAAFPLIAYANIDRDVPLATTTDAK
jgi:hypothetical protein